MAQSIRQDPPSPRPVSYQNSQDEDEEDENAELFAAVLACVDQGNLLTLASAVRQRSGTQHDEIPIMERPIYGSYHVLFPLKFPDDTRWLVKIPVNGAPSNWNEISSRALSAEANTMRLLKRETTIPMPDIFDFSATTDNQIGCSYMLMSFIPGKPLYKVWFGDRQGDLSPEVVERCRTRALDDIASAMAQLKRYSFDNGGFIMFNSDGNQTSATSTMRHINHQAMLDRWFIHKDPSDDPIYAESPPFTDPYDYFTFSLDLCEESRPFTKGVSMLLKLLISCIPSPSDTKPFVLAHPDYDIQNFLVSEEGGLQGIIDWDGIAAVPRSVGSERYPGWLTRDWDPAMYGYDESMDNGEEPKGVWEDSSKTLRHYRKLYRDMISKKRMESEYLAEAKPDEAITRMSLMTENLAIAAQDPQCRNDIIRKLVEAIAETSDGKVALDFMDLVNGFASGSIGADTIQALKRGMTTLLSRDGL
ncbi:hypothetical protein ACHAPT_012821 [Fusarium lateritium]